jgi:hypothetical protein
MLKDGYSKGYAWSNFDSVDTAHGDGPGRGPVLATMQVDELSLR